MRIFLIGFMGTGKSHWGEIWASRHNLTFIDLDVEIEKKNGLSIEEIFEKKGEDFFRDAETNSLLEMEQYDNCIIACGGGTPCFKNNMDWMNENGITVLLNSTPSKILENIINDHKERPLLKKINKGELLFFIEMKLKERIDFYNKASIRLEAVELNSNSIDAILNFKSTN
ncbi:MAG: shikimate kinase [Sphingobacteriales bacterium]|nr:shikimate kinase [Sphingobacteriales bacterium]